MSFSFPERDRSRPVWLITLADLALLLVGFFVLLQANQKLDRAALARGMREGFGAPVSSAPIIPPMPVAAAGVAGFAPGSAVSPQGVTAVIAWARDAARDPRVMVTVTGLADGSAADVDAATGSGPVLAVDRARALAAALAAAKAVPPGRLVITTSVARGRRAAIATLGFSGSPR